MRCLASLGRVPWNSAAGCRSLFRKDTHDRIETLRFFQGAKGSTVKGFQKVSLSQSLLGALSPNFQGFILPIERCSRSSCGACGTRTKNHCINCAFCFLKWAIRLPVVLLSGLFPCPTHSLQLRVRCTTCKKASSHSMEARRGQQGCRCALFFGLRQSSFARATSGRRFLL